MTRAQLAQVRDTIERLHLEICVGYGQQFTLSDYAQHTLNMLDTQQPSDFAALDTAYPTQARDAGA